MPSPFVFCFLAFFLKNQYSSLWARNPPAPPTPANPKPTADCVHGAGVAHRSGMPIAGQPAGCYFSRNTKISLSSALQTRIYSLSGAHPAVLTKGTWVQPGESLNRAPSPQRCADPHSIRPQNSINNIFFLHYQLRQFCQHHKGLSLVRWGKPVSGLVYLARAEYKLLWVRILIK